MTGTHFRVLVVVKLAVVKNLTFTVVFSILSSDISISVLMGHTAISRYRLLSQSPGHTFLELVVIENIKSAVGISILIVVVK